MLSNFDIPEDSASKISQVLEVMLKDKIVSEPYQGS